MFQTTNKIMWLENSKHKTGSPFGTFHAPPQGILPNRSGTAAHVVGYQVRLPAATGFSDSGTEWGSNSCNLTLRQTKARRNFTINGENRQNCQKNIIVIYDLWNFTSRSSINGEMFIAMFDHLSEKCVGW